MYVCYVHYEFILSILTIAASVILFHLLKYPKYYQCLAEYLKKVLFKYLSQNLTFTVVLPCQYLILQSCSFLYFPYSWCKKFSRKEFSIMWNLGRYVIYLRFRYLSNTSTVCTAHHKFITADLHLSHTLKKVTGFQIII